MRLRYVTVRPRTLIVGSLLVLAKPHEDVLPKTNFYVVQLPVERGSRIDTGHSPKDQQYQNPCQLHLDIPRGLPSK